MLTAREFEQIVVALQLDITLCSGIPRERVMRVLEAFTEKEPEPELAYKYKSEWKCVKHFKDLKCEQCLAEKHNKESAAKFEEQIAGLKSKNCPRCRYGLLDEKYHCNRCDLKPFGQKEEKSPHLGTLCTNCKCPKDVHGGCPCTKPSYTHGKVTC